jgi:Nup85 Nucleoporin.
MKEESQNITRPTSVLPTAFDPKSPATLIFAALPSPGSDSKNDSQTVPLNAFVSDSGIGCNAEETSALMRLIDARDDYLESHAKGDVDKPVIHPKALCKTYRRYLVECLQQWEIRLDDVDMKQDEDVPPEKTDKENIELLKLTHTFVYLCETFLLTAGDDRYADMSVRPEFFMVGLNSTSGVVTADTVRYLRYNHMIDTNTHVKMKLGEEMDLEKFMNIDQPEYYDPLSSASHDEGGLTPYWYLIRKLVLRGCLNEAWAVLSRHSACKKADKAVAENLENGGYMDTIVKEDYNAFALIRDLLLSAPLPGGREDIYDDGLEYEDETMEQDQEEFIAGIPLNAYKQWDANARGREFNIHAVMNMFKLWKSNVREAIMSHTPLRSLMRRIPMIQSCIWDTIFNTLKCFREEDVWAERLNAELIYVQPDIHKEDIYVRAKDYLQQCAQIDSDKNRATSHMETILLQIMQGNAGVVIQALSSYGGGSSAALPSAMTALLCSLLVESGKIELSQLSFDIETELLLSASSAILSSFSIQNHSDVGVRVSARLLRPYVVPENSQITAYFAEMLGRHWPKSDAETMNLLQSCKDAVSRGSKRMLDACDSLGFSRSKHHSGLGDFQKSTYFLLRGIEYISYFGPEVKQMGMQFLSSSTCFRRLALLCAETTQYVLNQIHNCFSVPNNEIDVSVLTEPLRMCKTIVETIAEDEISHLVSSWPSIELLTHVTDLALNFTLGKTTEAAEAIINCLKCRQGTDGSVIILANPGLYGYLLTCAYDILVAEDINASFASARSSFDVEGMQILFSRFTQYCSIDQHYIQSVPASSLRSDISHNDMRYALGRGLMRTFIVENAKLAQKDDVSQITQDDSLTERDVELLLGPSL